eukprot:564130-Pelagomonas_calceolata.AAC.1
MDEAMQWRHEVLRPQLSVLFSAMQALASLSPFPLKFCQNLSLMHAAGPGLLNHFFPFLIFLDVVQRHISSWAHLDRPPGHNQTALRVLWSYPLKVENLHALPDVRTQQEDTHLNELNLCITQTPNLNKFLLTAQRKKKESYVGKDLDLHGGTFSQTVRLIGL